MPEMLRLAPGIEVHAPEPGTKLRYAPEAAERVRMRWSSAA